MKLTKEQAITEHRKMWNYIADVIEEYAHCFNVYYLKQVYCFNYQEKYQVDTILDYCFLCEYTEGDCDKCPLEWVSKISKYMCEDFEQFDNRGLWRRCCYAEKWQEQAALARQIANLPERKDV